MTPWTSSGSELIDLWVSFAGRGGGHSKEFILKIYDILQSAANGNGRVSRQKLRERLKKEYSNDKKQLSNFDRIMRKLVQQQLVRKIIETQPDARTPNKRRTYYRINSGLVHRAIVPEGDYFVIPNYRENPPDPKMGEMWILNPKGPLSPPADVRKIVRVGVYRKDPQEPIVREAWLILDDKNE